MYPFESALEHPSRAKTTKGKILQEATVNTNIFFMIHHLFFYFSHLEPIFKIDWERSKKLTSTNPTDGQPIKHYFC